MIGIGVNILPFISKVARAVADYYNRVIADGGVSESLDCVNTAMSNINEINLLDQASLVMIPSGYKEDVVYSQIPTNGNGDLSFTRASNGTRINSAGLVEVVPWNLAFPSADFTTGWSANNGSVTANTTTNPIDGATTADTFTATAAVGSRCGFERSFSVTAGEISVSNFFKYSNNQWVFLALYDTAYRTAAFDIQNGVAGVRSSGVTSTITAVGSGWYRCTLTFTTASTTAYHSQGILSSNVTGVGSTTLGGEAFISFGAQLNIGSTAKPYFPTTDRLNVPRLTYQNGGGGCPSLLLEKQSTNLITYSEDFSQWTKQNGGTGSEPIITSNNAISPDGTQNADKVVFNKGTGTTTSDLSIISSSAFTSQTNTSSFYIKADIPQKIVVRNSTNWQLINVTTEWQRISKTDTGGGIQIGLRDGYGISNVPNTSTVYLWGAQAESGSYATSYIPTTSSSATRVADDCRKTGISSLIGQTEGTLFAQVGDFPKENNGRILGISDGTLNNYVIIIKNSTNTDFAVYATNGGIAQATYLGTGSLNDNSKIAVGYANNDYVVYVNGTLVHSDSSASVPACSSVWIGQRENGSVTYIAGGSLKQAILFPTRLTNAELEALTTL